MNKKNNKEVFALAHVLNNDIRGIIMNRMKKLGINQSELAKRMNKTRANISVLLTQDNILSIPIIISFCRALDIDFQIQFKERMPSVSTKIPEDS